MHCYFSLTESTVIKSSKKLMLAASITFADALGTRDITQADIE